MKKRYFPPCHPSFPAAQTSRQKDSSLVSPRLNVAGDPHRNLWPWICPFLVAPFPYFCRPRCFSESRAFPLFFLTCHIHADVQLGASVLRHKRMGGRARPQRGRRVLESESELGSQSWSHGLEDVSHHFVMKHSTPHFCF